MWTGNDHVFGLAREHAGDRLLLLGNFSAAPQRVRVDVARAHGFDPDAPAAPAAAFDLGAGDDAVARGALLVGDAIELGPYRFAWLHN